MTNFNVHITSLLKILKTNHLETLDIPFLLATTLDNADDIAFDISANIQKIGTGMAIYFHRVELTGKRDDFRRLALILFTQALTPSDKYVVIRLREDETNAIILAPVFHPLDFFEMQPLSLRYRQNSNFDQLGRFDVMVPYRDRPHIGFFEKQDPCMKIGHAIPSWVNQAVFFDGRANARARLAASILDHAHPNSSGDFQFERTREQVGSMSYDLSIHIED